jgi:hypothetical protein
MRTRLQRESEIIRLAAQYQEIIKNQHHKDCDCHWSIETKWSYGKAPVFAVLHNGFLHETDHATFTNYDSALAYLRQELRDAIELEKIQQSEGSCDVPGELRAFEL